MAGFVIVNDYLAFFNAVLIVCDIIHIKINIYLLPFILHFFPVSIHNAFERSKEKMIQQTIQCGQQGHDIREKDGSVSRGVGEKPCTDLLT